MNPLQKHAAVGRELRARSLRERLQRQSRHLLRPWGRIPRACRLSPSAPSGTEELDLPGDPETEAGPPQGPPH